MTFEELGFSYLPRIGCDPLEECYKRLDEALAERKTLRKWEPSRSPIKGLVWDEKAKNALRAERKKQLDGVIFGYRELIRNEHIERAQGRGFYGTEKELSQVPWYAEWKKQQESL